MGVFDNSVKTPLKVKDPGTDKTLSPSGALSYGAMTTPAGVAGCTGIDAKLVHGDRWQQVEQNHTTNIIGNDLFNVVQNQTHTIGANQTAMVAGTVNHTVVGAHNFLQVGAKTDVHVAPHSRMNTSPDSQQEPTNKMRIFGVEFEQKDTENTIITTKMEIVGMGQSFVGLANENVGVSTGLKGISYEGVLGIAIEPKLSEVELKPLHVFLGGGEAKAAAGHAAVVPSVNAVPHVPTAGGT